MMRTSDFDYVLPEELIAQFPPENRTSSRMLVLQASTGACSIHPFSDIGNYLSPGDALVVNNTRVIRARLFAKKETGAVIEIMLLTPRTADTWACFMKPAKRAAEGTVLQLLKADSSVSAHSITVVHKDPAGECLIRFGTEQTEKVIAECGHIPLPPYIKRSDLPPDDERYQTVYAEKPGAVAAPTAGLHFSKELLEKLKTDGIRELAVTLHVGAGTFKPVTEEDLTKHQMHTEEFTFTPECADSLNQIRASGHRITAVGTTTLRVLESCVRKDRTFEPRSGSTGIFIYPPYNVLSADNLLTNFHLPKSTLLMLVSAFAGVENIRRAYRMAIENRMRFFSYGDCMLILR